MIAETFILLEGEKKDTFVRDVDEILRGL